MKQESTSEKNLGEQEQISYCRQCGKEVLKSNVKDHRADMCLSCQFGLPF